MKNMSKYLVGLAFLLAQGGCALDDMEQTDGEEHISGEMLESTGQCMAGRMCFWDDNGFADTFKSLLASENDFDDIDFGDKTSSVWNRDVYPWVLYDDHDFTDTAVCMLPGASVANFGHFGFNDKVSSARRKIDFLCPSGVRVFQGMN